MDAAAGITGPVARDISLESHRDPRFGLRTGQNGPWHDHLQVTVPTGMTRGHSGWRTAPGSTESNVISAFGDETTGDVAPDYLLGGPTTGPETANGISYHAGDGVLLVTDFVGQQVKVFASASSGDSAPLRTFFHAAMEQPRKAVAPGAALVRMLDLPPAFSHRASRTTVMQRIQVSFDTEQKLPYYG